MVEHGAQYARGGLTGGGTPFNPSRGRVRVKGGLVASGLGGVLGGLIGEPTGGGAAAARPRAGKAVGDAFGACEGVGAAVVARFAGRRGELGRVCSGGVRVAAGASTAGGRVAVPIASVVAFAAALAEPPALVVNTAFLGLASAQIFVVDNVFVPFDSLFGAQF
mmetsp:Transcript_20875/g.57470  ORF Transcript_20875/g.57470 Transcript_20875/m.57470 type:complete len:164 (+) Transcript_20875:591-1082(+)